MTMKPILFNTEMVLAILEGRKTVTRRVVKFQNGSNPQWSGYIPDGAVLYGSNNIPAAKAPFRPGDILYVRETWGVYCRNWWEATSFEYRESWAPVETPFGRTEPPKWRPSIHMPKEAARIFLRVKRVSVERLQNITPEQIDAEGCKEYGYDTKTGALLPSGSTLFQVRWESTIKPADQDKYGWKANPWVWVIEFEKISKEEAKNAEMQRK